MSGASGAGELCGYRWPLIDPEPGDVEAEGVLPNMAEHRCGRAVGHFGPHRCPHDGVEAER